MSGSFLYESLPDGRVRCKLCPHRCVLKERELGLCGARMNLGGDPVNLTYGKVSIVAVERIEKRPIFHYAPGSLLLSIGSVGCNLKCRYCQNHEISQISALEYAHFARLSPERVVEMAQRYDGVAFTYNEPLINYEYVHTTAEKVKNSGKIVVLSTNGFVCHEPLLKLLPLVDAWNVDVKAFTEEFYHRYTGASLEPVKRTVELIAKHGGHLEITYLIVPGLNDSDSELRRFAEWLASISPDIPVHLPRFYPHYRMMDVPVTPLKKIERAARLMREYGITVHGGWEEHFGLWRVDENGVQKIKI